MFGPGDATEWPIVFQASDILREFRTNDMRNLFTKPVRGSSNARQRLINLLATLLARPFQRTARRKSRRAMLQKQTGVMSLHSVHGRKYLNTSERRRFLEAANGALPPIRAFCLILAWTGCRISEALALTAASFDLENRTVEFETIKRRRGGLVRQVPIPFVLLQELDHLFYVSARQRDSTKVEARLWSWSRSTAWRNVKSVMRTAGLQGTFAMPKGLRHAFGVAAFQTVPPHLVQRWLGHASLRTTAIYGDVSGPEERIFAERLWRHW